MGSVSVCACVHQPVRLSHVYHKDILAQGKIKTKVLNYLWKTEKSVDIKLLINRVCNKIYNHFVLPSVHKHTSLVITKVTWFIMAHIHLWSCSKAVDTHDFAFFYGLLF